MFILVISHFDEHRRVACRIAHNAVDSRFVIHNSRFPICDSVTIDSSRFVIQSRVILED